MAVCRLPLWHNILKQDAERWRSGTVNAILHQTIAHQFGSVALTLLMKMCMAKIGNRSVLVIDDDVGMLRALNRVLSGEGCMVANASSAEAAVKFLSSAEHYFDLIITDLRMPVLDGLGVLRAVKTAYPDVPVIIITAFGSPEAKTESYELGATAFLEKPVDTERLLATIDRVLPPPAQQTSEDES
jgi:DNA-binding NtrC family response regulator